MSHHQEPAASRRPCQHGAELKSGSAGGDLSVPQSFQRENLVFRGPEGRPSAQEEARNSKAGSRES